MFILLCSPHSFFLIELLTTSLILISFFFFLFFFLVALSLKIVLYCTQDLLSSGLVAESVDQR